MRYLLDVNALVALGFLEHVFHNRVASWLTSLPQADGTELLTCPITELGFVRVLAMVPQYGITVLQARSVLMRMKQSRNPGMCFIADGNDISHLPSWATEAKRTTDGHLLKLAAAHNAVLATLGERIPGAFLIPALPER